MSQTKTHGEAAPKTLNGVMLMVAVVSAASGLLYGYDTGIISGALLQISKEFATGDGMEQAIAAGILLGPVLGAVLGALACSFLSERFGRHKTILLICGVFIAGSLCCSLAPTAVTLARARVLLGFAVGGATQTAPMYVAEMAPANIRGRLVLCLQLAIGVGIVGSTLVGVTAAVDWRISIGAAAVPALMMLVLQLRLPESPLWLVKKDGQDEAEQVLERVRPTGYDISQELREIVDVEQRKHETKSSHRGWSGLRQRWVRPALIVGCDIAPFTQLSGTEMIIYYASSSTRSAGDA